MKVVNDIGEKGEFLQDAVTMLFNGRGQVPTEIREIHANNFPWTHLINVNVGKIKFYTDRRMIAEFDTGSSQIGKLEVPDETKFRFQNDRSWYCSVPVIERLLSEESIAKMKGLCGKDWSIDCVIRTREDKVIVGDTDIGLENVPDDLWNLLRLRLHELNEYKVKPERKPVSKGRILKENMELEKKLFS